jgi:phosphoribosylanthranilate isomerase
MNVKVKICGMRNLESAIAAIDAGADFLGFIFVPHSRRYIDPKDAKKIIEKIKGRVKIVGVFQDGEVEELNKTSDLLNLDFVQLHGEEDEDFMRQISRKIIKKFIIPTDLPVGDSLPLARNDNYFLLDRVMQGKGTMVDLETARKFSQQFPIFFAGGLTPENVAEVVRKVKPFAVDVAGGIETSGIADTNKIRQFILKAKGVNEKFL